MNAITNTNVKTGNYLHTTEIALAGTCEYDNVKIQIVDLPGFLGFKEDWKINKQIVRVARTCDAILLVIDLSDDVSAQYKFLIDQLNKAKIIVEGESVYNISIIGTKGDLPGSIRNFELLQKQKDSVYEILPISINNPQSLEKLKKYLFDTIDVIRIYTKAPRKEVDMSSPFVCPSGIKVSDIARKIHKDFIKQYKYAKIWGYSVDQSGQHVGLEHELSDKDVIEFILKK